MKKKMMIAIVAAVLTNNSVAFANTDNKVKNSNFKLQYAKLVSMPGFYKTTVETTINMDVSWQEICDLYKEYRTTGKSGFSQKLLKIIESKNGFGDLLKKYNYGGEKVVCSLIGSNKDCELVIDKFLKEASKNSNNSFKVKLRYRVTSINYELEVYPNEVESVELLAIDI